MTEPVTTATLTFEPGTEDHFRDIVRNEVLRGIKLVVGMGDSMHTSVMGALPMIEQMIREIVRDEILKTQHVAGHHSCE